MSDSLLREVGKMTLWVYVLGVVMAVVLVCIWGFDLPLLLGTLLGTTFAAVNFALTAVSVSQSVQKSENGAKAFMAAGYYLRLLLAATVIFWAIKAPYLNVFTAAIPLIFPRLIITARAVLDSVKQRKEKDGQDGC